MRIELYHASKFGNGAMVAENFKKIMASNGIAVNVSHIKNASPKKIPTADLYIFSSPGRMGKPIWGMRRFLKKLQVSEGSRYAILVTEMNPRANEKTGRMLKEEELGPCQRVIPLMNELLQAKGLKKVTEYKIYVTGIKGPLEDDWHEKVERFVNVIINSSSTIQLKNKSAGQIR